MPIYEYQCQECGHEFEVMQRMSDDLLTTCPACNKNALKKLISLVGFQLKGTGWYETDFKNKGKPTSGPEKKKGDEGSENKSKTEKKDGAQSDSGKQSGDSPKASVSSKEDT